MVEMWLIARGCSISSWWTRSFAIVAMLALLQAHPVQAGMVVSRVKQLDDPTVADPRVDVIECRAGWKDFQPNNRLDINMSAFEQCISEADANGKKAILQLDFAPPHGGAGSTNVPQWAKDAGARVVSDPSTREYPVWWDSTYTRLAMRAIKALTRAYNRDARVAGYVMTGYSGRLAIILAGKETEALCDNFQAEGFIGDCGDLESQTITSGSKYGMTVGAIMTFWARHTHKFLVYVARHPIVKGSLTEELEADPVGDYRHITVVNNGFRQCDQQESIRERFRGLQADSHFVGWWGLPPNGFTTQTLADGVACAAESLDTGLLWFGFAGETWQKNDDALQAAHEALHDP